MSTFREKCEQYFGTADIYEVLGLKRDANDKEIKKAYHKLSLLVHPDRVEEHQKEVATEKFKVLGQIHTILQDKTKREIYDECGNCDDETYSTFNWREYWMSMFKKVDLEAIKRYEKEYVGSDKERQDIKRAYVSTKGNINLILELVPFTSCEQEPRLIQIVREMVDNGEVEEYKAFFNESKAKRTRRHRKYEKERKEVEKIDVEEFERELEENMKRRSEAFCSMVASLEEKYAPKKARKSITQGPAAKKRTSSRRK